jgi:hypothetical protein
MPAQPVNPLGVYDPIKPAVETGSLAELVQPVEGALAGRLNKVVGLIGIFGQRSCKTAQTRKQTDHLMSQLVFPGDRILHRIFNSSCHDLNDRSPILR